MKSTGYWKNVFKNWANGRNFQANLEEYESNVLDQILSQFYAELRKKKKRGGLRARLPKSKAGITREIPKIKGLFKVHHPRQGVFLTPEKS